MGSEAIVPTPITGEAHREENPDPNDPVVGRWYWVTTKEDGKKETWLGCVTYIGSNYVKMTSVGEGSVRIHQKRFHDKCKPEPSAKQIVAGEIDKHRRKVAQLMGNIEEVTAQLGVSMGNKALVEGETQALAVRSSQSNEQIKSYKKALAKAKEKTLPELFKEIEEQNKQMAVWMKADLIPLKAQAQGYKPAIGAIEQRIFNVELYAGLCEETEKIKDGEPAPITEKLHLFQRRHYMDEECLANYEAGGMNFEKLGEFEEWLLKPANFHRIFPVPRCIIAFRVRRGGYDYYRDVQNWRQFIQMAFDKSGKDEADRSTYLYIRNGEQVWRLETKIEFDAKLFPDVEKQQLLTGQLYAKKNGHDRVGDEWEDRYDVITEWEYKQRRTQAAEKLWKYRAEMKAYKKEKAAADAENEANQAAFVAAWDAWADKVDGTAIKGKISKEERKRRSTDHWTWSRFKFPGDETKKISATGTETRLGELHQELEKSEPSKPDNKWVSSPHRPDDDSRSFEPWNKDSVYWDDIAKSVKNQIDKHNRLVLVLQGLFDRSLCLHPHPPAQLWTAAGFENLLELIYDDDRALTPGEKPDFEAYRARLNATLKPGCVTVGQDEVWVERETERYNNDARRSRRDRDNHYEKKRHRPEGNPGPGLLGRVAEVKGRNAIFRWQKRRAESNSWSYYERQRQRQLMDIPLDCNIKVPIEKLLNVEAYSPGDYKRFYADPRTRAEYLKWAPYMLIAEDYWAGKRKVAEMELKKREKVREEEVEIDTSSDDDDSDDSDD